MREVFFLSVSLPSWDDTIAPVSKALADLPAGETVRFWWRDDDASARSPALDRLLTLAVESSVPIGLAAIPGHLKPSLVDCLRGRTAIDVLVHGWLHMNHAQPGEQKSEYPQTRPADEVRAELGRGLAVLRDALPEQTIPVFVPPWNRFPPEFENLLVACGYDGLSSVSGSRLTATSGLRRAPCDMNIIEARDSAAHADIRGTAATAKRIRAGERGPFGVVSHHGIFDDAAWALCERFWKWTASENRVQVVSARSVFCQR